MNDEFASEVSEFDTMDEYKADVKQSLQDKKILDAKSKKEDEAIEAIIKDSEMDIPEAMLMTQQRQMLDDFARRLQMQGLSLEQYMQFTGMTLDKMLEQLRPAAEKRIQSRLVLEAIADAENFEVTEEEFEAELKKMADSYQMELDKMKEMMDDNEKKQIKKDLVVQKAVDYVVENAKESKPRATKASKAAAEDEAKEE